MEQNPVGNECCRSDLPASDLSERWNFPLRQVWNSSTNLFLPKCNPGYQHPLLYILCVYSPHSSHSLSIHTCIAFSPICKTNVKSDDCWFDTSHYWYNIPFHNSFFKTSTFLGYPFCLYCNGQVHFIFYATTLILWMVLKCPYQTKITLYDSAYL